MPEICESHQTSECGSESHASKSQLHLPSVQCLSFHPGDESLALATLDKTATMLKALLHFLTCFSLCFCFPHEIVFKSTITWWHTIFIPGVMPDTSTPRSAHRALTHGRHQADSTGWEADIRSEPPPTSWIADWETAICAAGWGRRLPAVSSVRQATLSRRSWTLLRVWLSQRYCELRVKQLHWPPRRDPLSQYLHLKLISPPRDNKGSSCLI